MGRDACWIAIEAHFFNGRDPLVLEEGNEALRQVSEMRAGLREIPEDLSTLHPVTQIYLGKTKSATDWMAGLEQALGEERAHALWGHTGCKVDGLMRGGVRAVEGD